MNTGIMDAHNLAWKLALVASGHAPDRLLDSYGDERGPVAADVLALTHALVKLGTMTHPVPRALRNTIVPIAGHLAPIQRRAVRRISHIHVAYPSSALTHPGRLARRPPAGPAGTRPRSDRQRRKNPALRGLAPRPARTPDLRPRRGLAAKDAPLAGPDRCGHRREQRHGPARPRPRGEHIPASARRLCGRTRIRDQAGQPARLPAPAVRDHQGTAARPSFRTTGVRCSAVS